jgi:hypothetical protein
LAKSTVKSWNQFAGLLVSFARKQTGQFYIKRRRSNMAREPMPMPDMAGANMNSENPMQNLPPEAQASLLEPNEEIGAMLVARLSAMTPQELQMIDRVITPEVAQVLTKLLPELQELIAAVEGGGEQMAQAPQQAPAMGALGGMG